jgi:hypothetical protein
MAVFDEVKPPFFIIGTERSGTNLLRLILNSHSNIAIPHPPHIMKNLFKLEPFYGDLSKDLNFMRLIRDVETIIRLHPYPWGIKIDKNEIFRQVRERNLINVFFAVYEQYLESTLKKRWGCKSTFMIYHVELIKRYYPSAKFIYMVRDGRDVAASARKTIFNRYNIYFIANLWKKEQEIGISWRNRLSKEEIFLVRYEDLLSKPAETVSSLCLFLDEPYQEDMLSFFDSAEAKKSGSLSEAWRNTSSPIIKDNYGKFNAQLSKNQVILFESIAGKELEHFSYALTKPVAFSTGKQLKRDRFKFTYLIEEIFLMVLVQLRHVFTDKNSFLRFKKFIFLQYLKISLALKWR